MKSQDIVIAVKLVGSSESKWSYAALGADLGIGHNQAHLACKRLVAASLMNEKKIIKRNLVEFLVYGLKYVFPPVWEGEKRGVPVACSGPIMKDELRTEQIVVWSTGKRKHIKGDALTPLHKCVLNIVDSDPFAFQALSVAESIRAGRARERNIAVDHISNLILGA